MLGLCHTEDGNVHPCRWNISNFIHSFYLNSLHWKAGDGDGEEMRKKMGMEKEMERRWGGEVDGYGVWDGVGMEYRMEKGTEKGMEMG